MGILLQTRPEMTGEWEKPKKTFKVTSKQFTYSCVDLVDGLKGKFKGRVHPKMQMVQVLPMLRQPVYRYFA